MLESVSVLDNYNFQMNQYLETINILASFFVTHYFSADCNFLMTAEILVLILTIKSSSISNEKDLIPRLLGVLFASIVRLGLPSSILLFCFIILILFLEAIYSKIWNLEPRICIHKVQKKSKLNIDPQVWSTEEKSFLIRNQFSSQRQQSSQRPQSSSQNIQQSQKSSSKKTTRSIAERAEREGEIPSQTSQICSSFIINNEHSDMMSSLLIDNPSDLRSDFPQITSSLDHNPTGEANFRPHSNINNIAVNDYFLNHISQGFMLCKLSELNFRNSDKTVKLGTISYQKELSAQSLDIRLGVKKPKSLMQRRQRKIQLRQVQKSDQFFKKLPFYNEVQALQNIQVETMRASYNSQGLMGKPAPQAFRSTVLQKVTLTNSGEQSMQNGTLKNDSSYQINKERLSTVRDQIFSQELTFAEDQLLELKIYQPYFISNSTIIQFERHKNFNVKPEKLSIMDILQTYFIQNNNKSSLFFKVNLGDVSEITLLKQWNDQVVRKHSSAFGGDMSCSFESSLNSKIIDSKKVALMEEIKEQSAEGMSIKKYQDTPNKAAQRKNRFSQMSKKGASGDGRKIIDQYKRKTKRKTSQEMNEIINNYIDVDDQPKRPTVRKTANLQSFSQNLMQPEPASKKSVSSSNSSDSSLFCEQDININASIQDSVSSSGTFHDFNFHKEQCDSNFSIGKKFEMQQDLIRYYEFEIQQVDDLKDQKNLTFINIKDVTKLVQNQQKLCDIIYQDAIENNFSHEQMTPLNPILNQSVMIKHKLIQLYLEKYGIVSEHNEIYQNIEGIDYKDIAIVVKNSPEAKSVIQQLTSIEQAAKLIWYYNTNNIKRMKIKKNQLDIEATEIEQIDEIIFNVLWPFEHFVFKRRHNVHLIKSLIPGQKMKADWKLYELILFNLVQNSIKYNQNFDGDVVIVIKCKPLRRRESDQDKLEKNLTHVLETIIIDTGIGIQEDRQDLLFIPFLELKNHIGIMKTQNDNIGIGLACSKDICKRMGGDIMLKISQKGLTAFSFKMPIQLIKSSIVSEQNSVSMYSGRGDKKTQIDIERLLGIQRPIPDNVLDLLEAIKVIPCNQVNSSQDQSKRSIRSRKLFVNESPNIISQKYGFQFLEDLSQKRSHSHSNGLSRDVSLRDQQKMIQNKNKQFRKNVKSTRSSISCLIQGVIGVKATSHMKQSSLGMTSKRESSLEKQSRESQQKFQSSQQYIGLKNLDFKQKYEKHQSDQSLILKSNSVSNQEKKSFGSLCSKINDIQEEIKKEGSIDRSIKEVLDEKSQSEVQQSCSFVFENEGKEEEKVENKQEEQGYSLQVANQNLMMQYDISNENIANGNHEGEDSGEIRKQVLKLQNPLANQIKFLNNQERDKLEDKELKMQCFNNILYNNHKNSLLKIVQDGNQQYMEMSSSDEDSDDLIQDLLVDRVQGNQNLMCLYLANYTQRSSDEFDNSFNYINLRPPQLEEDERAIVIRASDFIVNQTQRQQDSVAHIERMRREEEKKEVAQYNGIRLSSESVDLLSSHSMGLNNYSSQQFNHQIIHLPNSLDVIENPHREPSQNSSIAPIIRRENNISKNNSATNKCNCRPRILSVDDNDFNLLTLNGMIFDKLKIKPEEAQNGEIAVQMYKEAMKKECKCKNRAYKLIFMDIQMPIMDGYEATQQINKLVEEEIIRLNGPQKKSKSQQEENITSGFCNIVAVTSYTSNEVKEKCLKLGMKKVLHKPVNWKQLPEIIEKYLNN